MIYYSRDVFPSSTIEMQRPSSMAGDTLPHCLPWTRLMAPKSAISSSAAQPSSCLEYQSISLPAPWETRTIKAVSYTHLTLPTILRV